jgi:hypothetical protein
MMRSPIIGEKWKSRQTNVAPTDWASAQDTLHLLAKCITATMQLEIHTLGAQSLSYNLGRSRSMNWTSDGSHLVAYGVLYLSEDSLFQSIPDLIRAHFATIHLE